MSESGQAASPEKAAVKAKIRTLKAKRSAALEAKDREQLRRVRRQIRVLKRRLRKTQG